MPRTTTNRRPIRVTDRDEKLLRHLAGFGMLTTEQVYRLCFSSISRARKRLRLLWQHRLIARHSRPVRMGEGTAPYLYILTSRGRKAIGDSTAGVLITRRTTRLSLHSEKINDFHIALMLAAKDSWYPTLSKWQQGRGLHFTGTAHTDQVSVRVPIVPDAFFVLALGKQEFAYFLEMDRGTTDLKRIKVKLLAYLDLWRSKVASKQLRIRSFRVLYITTTQRRLQNILKVIEGLHGGHRRTDVLCITEQGKFSLQRPEKLFEPIWETVDQTGHNTDVRAFPVLPVRLPTAPTNPAVRGPDAGAG